MLSGRTHAALAPDAAGLDAPHAGCNDIDYGTNGLYPAFPFYHLTTGMGSFDLNAMKIVP